MAKLEIFDGTNWIILGGQTNIALTGAVTGNGSSSIATTLNNYQTMVGSTLSFDWSNNGSFAEYSNYHTLEDSNPPPHFVHIVQSGSGSTYRKWLTVYQPGSGSQPTGTYEIKFYHAVNGFQYPFKIDTYGSTLRTYFGTTVNMQNNAIINLVNPQNPQEASTKYYVDNKTWPYTQITNFNTGVTNYTLNQYCTFGTGFAITTSQGPWGSPAGYIAYNNGGWNELGFHCQRGTGTGGFQFSTWNSSNQWEGAICNMRRDFSQFNTPLYVYNNAGLFSLYGQDHAYIQFYPRTNQERKAWIGYGSEGIGDFTISNEDYGALKLYTGGENILIGDPAWTILFGNGLSLVYGDANRTILSGGGTSAFALTPTYNSSLLPMIFENGSGKYQYFDVGIGAYRPTGFDSFYFPGQYGWFDIYCKNIACSVVWIYSSQKIKNILSKDQTYIEKEAIKTIKSLPFFSYAMKDDVFQIPKFGLVAEYTREVLPAYVCDTSKDYIPNIMKEAIIKSIDNKEISFELESPFVEKLDSALLEFMVAKTQKTQKVEIISYTEQEFVVKVNEEIKDLQVGDKILVYGTHEDCPSILKDQLFEVNLIATKNLLKRVEKIEKFIIKNKLKEKIK